MRNDVLMHFWLVYIHFLPLTVFNVIEVVAVPFKWFLQLVTS